MRKRAKGVGRILWRVMSGARLLRLQPGREMQLIEQDGRDATAAGKLLCNDLGQGRRALGRLSSVVLAKAPNSALTD